MTISEQPPAADGTAERQRWLAQKRRQVEEEQANASWAHGRVASPHSPGWEQRHWTSRLLHRIGDVAGHSGAGIVAAILVAGWVVVGLALDFPRWWETVLVAVTASVTFVMVFVIQHTQERQTAGTQRKLDELIRSSTHADNSLIAVEEAPAEELQARTHLNLEDRTRAAGEELE